MADARGAAGPAKRVWTLPMRCKRILKRKRTGMPKGTGIRENCDKITKSSQKISFQTLFSDRAFLRFIVK